MKYSMEEAMQLAVLFCELEHGVPGHVDRLTFRQNFCRFFSTAIDTGISLFEGVGDWEERLLNSYFSAPEIALLRKKILDSEGRRYLQKRARQEFILCAEHDIGMIPYGDSRYPAAVRETGFSPPMLFYQGTFPQEGALEKSLCIVGTRTPEENYAPSTAFWAAGELARRQWMNISGLALGCDTYGHLSSLQLGGRTGAILGNGLARTPYPPENLLVAEKIVEKGGFILSESIPSAEATSTGLILRDRLQSAMSRGIFVIETDLGSGTMFTVDYALRMNKVVFVWDPSGTEVEKESALAGNRVLLGKTAGPAWFFLPELLKSDRIIPVSDGQEFTSWMDGLNGRISSWKC